jgi:RNA polymerase sigma-70 factor (ECF subfamily)
MRRRTSHGFRVGLEDEMVSLLVTEAEQEERMVVRDLLAGLQLLPVEQRAVVLLVGVEEMTYAEAAKVLGIPVGTVMSRLSRGRESLHRYLETGRVVSFRRVK